MRMWTWHSGTCAHTAVSAAGGQPCSFTLSALPSRSETLFREDLSARPWCKIEDSEDSINLKSICRWQSFPLWLSFYQGYLAHKSVPSVRRQQHNCTLFEHHCEAAAVWSVFFRVKCRHMIATECGEKRTRHTPCPPSSACVYCLTLLVLRRIWGHVSVKSAVMTFWQTHRYSLQWKRKAIRTDLSL